MFDLGWVFMPPQPPPSVGLTVGFASTQFGVWTINTCRVVYVVDEDGPIARAGFAYGTLAPHAVAGEERFVAEWDRSTDVVRFGISKFSRPAGPIVALAGPFATSVQRRFTADALARIQRAVGG